MSVSILFAIIGFILVAFVLLDIVVTTMTMDGGGAASNWLSYTNWRMFRLVKKLTGKSRMIMVTGPVTLIIVILFWVVTTWFGWVLIFSWDAISIVRDDGTGRIADWGERIYFTGYTISTIGYGDFRAQDRFGQIASVIAGLNGISLVTLAVTYSMQVLTAVTEKRSLALIMNMLEITESPDESANKEELQGLASELSKLNTSFASAAQKYLAYPVIHFFPDRNRQSSLPLKVADLWRRIESAEKHQHTLSTSTKAQFKKTKILIRALVTNAIKCHWAFEHGTKLDSHNLQGEPLEKLVRAYVNTGGWDWDEDTHS